MFGEGNLWGLLTLPIYNSEGFKCIDEIVGRYSVDIGPAFSFLWFSFNIDAISHVDVGWHYYS